MKLNEIRDNAGARTVRKRVGRGAGSGLGKTAGKGQKGQKARTGVAIGGFEGGQMPLHRRLPKRGFTSLARRQFRIIGLDDVQAAIEAGRIDPSQPIAAAQVVAAGIVKTAGDGIRLLANGAIKTKVNIEVAGASKAAIAAVEKAGGKVVIAGDAKPAA